MFKILMTTALDGAKLNMRTFGYLEHVLIAMTRKGPLISSLTWATNAEKTKVIRKCVKKVAQMGCLMYTFIGEANFRRFKLNNLSNRFKQINSKTIDCVVVCGETREGGQSVIITPIFKNSSNNQITCGKSIWIDKIDQIAPWINFKMFKGIFNL